MSSIERIVQTALARLGLRLTRVERLVEPVLPFDLLEVLVTNRLFRSGGCFSFIQVDAYGGIQMSGLASLIRRHRLHGHFVVSDRDVLAMLRKEFADQPQITIVDATASERCPNSGDAPGLQPSGMCEESFDRLSTPALPDLSTSIASPGNHAGLFAGLMQSLDTQSIDLLLVDTANRNGDIISRALANGVHPAIIQYEWTAMTLPRRCAIKSELSEHGYRFIDVGADTLCLKED